MRHANPPLPISIDYRMVLSFAFALRARARKFSSKNVSTSFPDSSALAPLTYGRLLICVAAFRIVSTTAFPFKSACACAAWLRGFASLSPEWPAAASRADAQNWYLLGRAYMTVNMYQKAYEAYQQAVYRDGRNPAFWCSIGILFFHINRYRDALDAYCTRGPDQPGHPRSLV